MVPSCKNLPRYFLKVPTPALGILVLEWPCRIEPAEPNLNAPELPLKSLGPLWLRFSLRSIVANVCREHLQKGLKHDPHRSGPNFFNLLPFKRYRRKKCEFCASTVQSKKSRSSEVHVVTLNKVWFLNQILIAL